jgi:tetratricopeptide (TPR) repeat protein
MQSVQVNVENMIIPTYEPAEYEEMPMFAFNRIHQGTTGNPFPHRVINKVRRDSKVDKSYTAVHLENEYLDIIILPELGGKIFAARDKTNGLDFFYRQHVIKPALIGIYGLWISGGLEFNWPRHHRPSTFMPTDFAVERLAGGGVIVWLSEHDPLFRMKGMVGIALYPGRAVLETRMKVFNRTNLPHSFHWWENAAVPADENFQMFFPPDVSYVNYHYRKATGAYPVMDGYFYVQDNRGGKDIRFHKNSEMATSYFSGLSKYNFFGGYDHGKKAGVIHHASHYSSPGKKMFTWGYKNRAKAWEQALTDSDGPYAELMASSYGDNQPDFAWIEPYEVKEFNQVWYPYKELGEVQAATEEAALNYRIEGNTLLVNLYSTENFPQAVLDIEAPGGYRERKAFKLEAARPLPLSFSGLKSQKGLSFTLRTEKGGTLLRYEVEPQKSYVPEPIDNTPHPDDFEKADTACAAGVHIDQYYDPAIEPSAYWLKGLSIDPDHAGCLTNLGRYYLTRQNYEEAEEVLRKAVQSITRYNSNPRNPEALYLLGLVLARRKAWDEALELLHKSRWSAAWIVPASCVIAGIYSGRGEYRDAEVLLRGVVENSGKNQRVMELLITMLRKQGKTKEAQAMAEELLRSDMLDLYVLNELRILGDGTPAGDRFKYRQNETGLDLAGDYVAMGLWGDALELITWISGREEANALLLYTAGYLCSLMGETEKAKAWYSRAGKAPQGMRFASLPLEREALEDAIKVAPDDGRALDALGTLTFGVRRKSAEAVACWREALRVNQKSPKSPITPITPMIMRNLAAGLFSMNNKDQEVLALLEEAVRLKPGDEQLVYERNIASELLHINPEKRLDMWKGQQINPEAWDEIYLQGVQLFNQLGQWETALKMLLEHTFIPAEGGEAVVGAEYSFVLEALGYDALRKGDAEKALKYFEDGCNSPLNIGGGALHEVCNCPNKYGTALCLLKLGRKKEAEAALLWICSFPVDYFTQSMLPSYLYYRGMAFRGLGREKEGKEALEALKQNAKKELGRKEYGLFASSSAHSSYIRDPAEQRHIHYGTLLALALSGLGEKEQACAILEKTLTLDPFNKQAGLLKLLITGGGR